MVSFADSLDCVGVLARDVSTVKRVHSKSALFLRLTVAEYLLDALAVFDRCDPTAAPKNVREKATQLYQKHLGGIRDGSLAGLRIGVPQVSITSSSCDRNVDISTTCRSTSLQSCKVMSQSLLDRSCSNYKLVALRSCLCHYRRRHMPSVPTMSYRALRLVVTWLGMMVLNMVSVFGPRL